MDPFEETMSTSEKLTSKLGTAKSPKSGGDKATSINSSKLRQVLRRVELDIENQFAFLKCICYKQGKNYDKCQKEYQKLEKIF